MSPDPFIVFKPHDPLQPEYVRFDTGNPVQRAHDMFQRRMGFQAFNREYLNTVINALEHALVCEPGNDRVCYELAFTLVQNHPDEPAIRRAKEVLDACGTDEPKVARLSELVARFVANLADDRDGYCATRVNWAINDECPMVCTGCYNPFSATQLTLEQAKLVAERLAEGGVEALSVSGGDPLLWRYLLPFATHVRSLGIRIGIDTTGYTISPELLAPFIGVLTQMSLPMDGSRHDLQKVFRKSPSKDLTVRFRKSLAICDEVGFEPVRIHTVVSRYNIDDLENIGDIITQYKCVAAWVLFPWWGRRATQKMVADMSLESDRVHEAKERLAQRYPQLNIRVFAPDAREFANFYVQNSGRVVTFGLHEGEEFLIGDLLEQSVGEILRSPILDRTSLNRHAAAMKTLI